MWSFTTMALIGGGRLPMNFNPNNLTSIEIFGFFVMQTWFDLFFINEILKDECFDTYIELGTAGGGLAIFLGLHAFRRNAEALTFDIKPEIRGELWNRFKEVLPLKFYSLNVFSEEAKNIIKEKAQSGRIFLYCDGGEKPHDFATYAPILEANDVVIVHDKGREISEDEATPIAKRNGLVPFYQKEADKIGADVFSYIKKFARRDKNTEY